MTAVVLPALNTPQFSWGRTKMPRQPRPVPPIFEPEVAADAIVWASRKRAPRTLRGGWPTAAAIVGNKIAPGLVDVFLARTGYGSQQIDEPVPSDRRDNLFESVPGDFAARGPFADRAKTRSVQLFLTKHRRWLAAGALVALAGAVLRD